VNIFIRLLQIDLNLHEYKFNLLTFISAFVLTMISVPPLISLLKKYNFYDMPGDRKTHNQPVPNMGGIAIAGGMIAALMLWFPFAPNAKEICFFLCLIILLALGIMDDIKDLSARYKFIIQIGIASLMTVSGVRVTSLFGLFGINELPLIAQYTFTVIAIVGITNAFNLIDGIDGLAGGLGFMSLVTLGILLTLNGDNSMALVAFALAGGILAFLFYNFSPAKIFMGDTGSLTLGFVIAVLCIRLMQSSIIVDKPVIYNIPVFVLSVVLIPVFDTIRVFAVRIWNGKSPFTADNTHIHHMLTLGGVSHLHATRLICSIHGIILMNAFWLQDFNQEFVIAVFILLMILVTIIFRNTEALFKKIVSFRTALLIRK